MQKTLPASRVTNRETALPPPSKEPPSKHMTIEEYRASEGVNEAGRRLQRPQRAHDDGSGRSYTKSPDYVKSYEKIEKFARK